MASSTTVRKGKGYENRPRRMAAAAEEDEDESVGPRLPRLDSAGGEREEDPAEKRVASACPEDLQ